MTDEELMKWALDELIDCKVREDAEYHLSRSMKQIDEDGQTPAVIKALRERLTQSKPADI